MLLPHIFHHFLCVFLVFACLMSSLITVQVKHKLSYLPALMLEDTVTGKYNCISCCLMILVSCCRIRVPYPFQWGAPTFDAGEAFAMMLTSFVALVEVCLSFILIFGTTLKSMFIISAPCEGV